MNETSQIPELDFDPYSVENLTDPYPMQNACAKRDRWCA